jgi:hypothetical protein
VRREDAGVEERVRARSRNERGEPPEEDARAHRDARRALAPRSFHFDAGERIAQELDTIESDRRAQHVATQVLEPVSFVLVDGHVGVEVPSVDARLSTRRQEHEAQVRLGRVLGSVPAEAAPLWASGSSSPDQDRLTPSPTLLDLANARARRDYRPADTRAW